MLATLVVGVSVAFAQTQVITTIAGNGTAGPAGDGGPANAAQLSQPVNVSPIPSGGYLIVDQGNSKVRRVDAAGTITTVAGTGTPGFSGDGGPATSAQLNAPNAAVMRAGGEILIADSNNNRVRSVATDGTITTVVGNGAATFSGDGGPASAATVAATVRVGGRLHRLGSRAATIFVPLARRPASGLLTPSFTVRAPGVRPVRVRLAVFRP